MSHEFESRELCVLSFELRAHIVLFIGFYFAKVVFGLLLSK